MRPTCGDCIYCQTSKQYVKELRKWGGGPVTDDTPRKDLYIADNKSMYCYINICLVDLRNIHQISDRDDMCRFGRKEIENE